jgi:hypothetical protein
MNRRIIELMLVLCAGTASVGALTQCEKAKEPTVEADDKKFGVHLLSLIPCPNGNPDCVLAKPSCASSAKCDTTTHYCDFGVTATMACVPPDVQFCDPGGHTECVPDGAAYPADASHCGVKECLADASVCYWSSCMNVTSH